MKKRPCIGIIGTGMIGDIHIKKIKEDGRADITWICSKTEKTINKKLKIHKIKNGTTDYKELLKDKSIDAVVIATPPYLHLRITEDTLKSNKHILLEKPAVTNLHDLKKLISITQKYPKQKILDCSCRHTILQPKFNYIKKIISTGLLGDIYHIHHKNILSKSFIEYNPKALWALDKNLSGGGPILDWGVYDLSFHLGILNKFPVLKNILSFKQTNLKKNKIKNAVEDHFACFLKFNKGLTYYWERGRNAYADYPNQTIIYGTRGELRFSYTSWEREEIEYYSIKKDRKTQKKVFKLKALKHDDNLALTRHFINCLLNKETPCMPVSLSSKYLSMIFKIMNI